MSKWENDTAVPTTDNMVQLSKIFDTSIDYFLNDKSEQAAKADTLPVTQGKTSDTIRTLVAIVTLLVISVAFLRYRSVISKIEIDNKRNWWPIKAAGWT